MEEFDCQILYQRKEGWDLETSDGIQCPLMDIFSYRAMVNELTSSKDKAFDVSSIQIIAFLSILIENSHQRIIWNGVNDNISHISVTIY